MRNIQQLREDLEAGSYWLTSDNGILRLEDIPTDGPLFKDLLEEHTEFEMVQMGPEEFENRPLQPIRHGEGESGMWVKFYGSGVEHRFEFGRSEGNAWPKIMVQGGESYTAVFEEIPDWLELFLEDAYGLKLVRR